ncbi:MAG: hypothetical protein ACHREM_01250 [Polyangiales bacterium]
MTVNPIALAPPMRFRVDGKAMDPFWAQLPMRVVDATGDADAQIGDAGPDVSESYKLDLRGTALLFDDVENLFARHLGDSARVTWLLDVEVLQAGESHRCTLRVDGWKTIPKAVVVSTYPRPSFFIRAAITLEMMTILSRWHIDWSGGFEDALSDLRAALGGGATIRSCFFCKWSDYEPSTSTAHLGCFRDAKAEYEAIATADDNWTRKYKKEGLHARRVWVDELNSCREFERRPKGFGYRG